MRSPLFAGYQSIASQHSTRQMTDSGDAINAIDGLLFVIRASMDSDMVFGLPESVLDAALLWRGEQPLQSRGRGTGTCKPSLPSWSWAGWWGHVGYDKPIVYSTALKIFGPIDPVTGHLRSYSGHIRPFVSWCKPSCQNGLVGSPEGLVHQQVLVNGTGLGIRITEGRLREN